MFFSFFCSPSQQLQGEAGRAGGFTGFSAWAQFAQVGSWGKRVSGGGNVAQERAVVGTNQAGSFHLGDLPGICPYLVSDLAKLEDMIRLKMS